jgi:hypothetical protein
MSANTYDNVERVNIKLFIFLYRLGEVRWREKCNFGIIVYLWCIFLSSAGEVCILFQARRILKGILNWEIWQGKNHSRVYHTESHHTESPLPYGLEAVCQGHQRHRTVIKAKIGRLHTVVTTPSRHDGLSRNMSFTVIKIVIASKDRTESMPWLTS